MISIKNTVIENGFCIGCGVCTSIENSGYTIKMNKYGMFTAEHDTSFFDKNIEQKLINICPFTSIINETDIAKENYDDNSSNYDEYIGFYKNLYAGFVNNNDDRISSSSGGILTLVLKELLYRKEIDGVIHVKSNEKDQEIFSYEISYSIQEVNLGKKTRYYPISLSEVLKIIKNDHRAYAVVGLPCFIKALRLLLKEENHYNIKYFIGIICGQLKSKYFSNVFTFPNDINHNNIKSIDYRVKLKDKHAADYAVSFTDNQDTRYTTKQANKIFGSDWGLGTLKYQACDTCDDVFNETSDIVFGDAWIDPYNKYWKGTNIIITRNSFFENLLNTLLKENKISLDIISKTKTLKSQDPSIRHRRNNLGYRLYKFQKTKNWIPIKRITPTNIIDHNNKRIQNIRLSFSNLSHKAMYLANRYNKKYLFYIILYPMHQRYLINRYGIKYLVPNWLKTLVKSFSHNNL